MSEGRYKGQRGSWKALDTKINRMLPVVHSTKVNWQTMTYHEGNNTQWVGRAPAPGQKWPNHLNFIKECGMVIVQKDKSPDDPSRAGYVGTFIIKDVVIDGDEITFTIVQRV